MSDTYNKKVMAPSVSHVVKLILTCYDLCYVYERGRDKVGVHARTLDEYDLVFWRRKNASKLLRVFVLV